MNFKETFPTLRIYTQAIELINQSAVIQSIYADMEEVWLTLHTKDKKCPIVDQVGTIVKRNLVRRYTGLLIRSMRNVVNLDLVSKSIDADAAFWHADDIVQRISDNKTEDHKSLFLALMNTIFGISLPVLEFTLKNERTKQDLYDILAAYYDVTILDLEPDDALSISVIISDFENLLNNEEPTLFKANIF